MEFRKFRLRDGTELSAPMKIPMKEGKGVGQVGYQVFLQENVGGIMLHMEAVNRASKMFFKDVETVLHPFGGLGMAAQCMEKTLGRKLSHSFWERDENCCDALRVLYPNAEVFHVVDSFRVMRNSGVPPLKGYDVVFLDPTAMTCKKEDLWDIYAMLAEAEVPNIWFVDSAISKIWLHLKTYSEFFGEEVKNINDYFRAYNNKLGLMGLEIKDLCREGTVVYGVVGEYSEGGADVPDIIDLRQA